jgi:hypothetical protein
MRLEGMAPLQFRKEGCDAKLLDAIGSEEPDAWSLVVEGPQEEQRELGGG